MQSLAPEESGSERTCIVTGAVGSPDAMIRFVLDPAGVVTPDLGAKLPGRGAWLTASKGCVEHAASKRLFSRAFRREASLGEGVDVATFSGRISAMLRDRALKALGLARRAGVAACGFDMASEALRDGGIGVVFVASDAGADGTGKIGRLAGDIPVVAAFSSAELSAALGKSGLVYVAMRDGHEARRAAGAADRMLRYEAEQTV